jgi:hypothetical protein
MVRTRCPLEGIPEHAVEALNELGNHAATLADSRSSPKRLADRQVRSVVVVRPRTGTGTGRRDRVFG